MMQAGLGAFAPSAVGAAPPMPPVPTQPGGIAPLPDRLKQLIEESRIVKQINAKHAMEGQQAGAQMARGLPTVREQIDRALGATPYGFAGGGIVAFADGGLTDEDLEGLGEEDAFLDKPLYDMLLDYVRGLRSGSAEAPAGPREPLIDRAIRAMGGNVPVSEPRPGAEARALRGAPTEATTPTLPAYLDESRRRDVLPAVRPAAAAQPVARPAASATPPAATQSPPATRPDGLGDAFNALRQQQNILADLVKSQGTTPDEVLEARRQYDTATAGMLKGEEDALAEMEAAAQRGMFDNPEILAGILAGMQGTDRLGETLLGAATGAARGRASQKKAIAEAKKDLNKLRRDLAMKQAELQLARKEGDVNRARAAAVEVQKIKVAIEDKAVEERRRERQLDIQEQVANAQMTAAQQRGEARTELTANQRATLRDRAADNVAKDPQTNLAVIRAQAEAKRQGIPFDAQAFREQLIERQYQQLLAAAEGRTLPATSGASVTTPGAAPALSPADQALIEKYSR